MLRFLSERRAWVLGALVSLMVVVGLRAWGVPYAKARASRGLEQRLGMTADIGTMEVSFAGLQLGDVVFRGEHGGVVVRVQEIAADANLLAAAFRGAQAVRRLAATGVEVTVDLADPGAARSIELARKKILPKPISNTAVLANANGGGGRAYDLQKIQIRVVDAYGPLLTIEDAALRKESHQVVGKAVGTLLGERHADHAFAGPTQLELRRNDGTWKLASLEVLGGEVRALQSESHQNRALALRVRDGLELVRANKESDGPTEDVSKPPPGSRASARLFARLDPDVDLVVSDVQIESRTSKEGRVERIRDLRLSVRGGNDGWYRVEVGGQTTNRGTVNVDLSIHPQSARAEGSLALRRISLALIAPFIPEVPLYEADAGTLDAQLELAADSTDRIAIEGGLQVDEVGLFHERIAAEPIEHIGIAARGKGAWFPDERRLEIELGQMRMNEARVMVEGELQRTSEYYRVDLTAKLPPTACNDVVGAIPRDVLGSLSRFEWSGSWSALAQLSLDSRDLQATELTIRVRNLCDFVKTPKWVRVERFQEPFRHRVVEPDETIFQMRTGPGTDSWVAFEDISPFVVPAVISHEDGGFFEHAGFAPWAIRDALVRNLEEGRYVVGASTISMQLAKNLYLQREKTLSRKAQEVILTWWLESALTKEQILELYLNVIEYGPRVYGLRNAAAYYFGREPHDLSPAESAFLACMLPSPKNYHVSYERGELTRSMKNRSRRLLEHMAKRERIGPEALTYGLAELEDFHFWRFGDPPPPERILPPLGAPEEPRSAELDPYEALFVSP
jgi:hypothetical protein